MMEEQEFLRKLGICNQQLSGNYPTKELALKFLNQLTNILFPVDGEVILSTAEMDTQWKQLKLLLMELLSPIRSFQSKSENELVEEYFRKIPEIYNQLNGDAKAIFEFDPAAHSLEEIILAYPGFQAIMTYRLAHPLYQLRIPILPRMLSEFAHTNTGIDINPGATIGKSFFIDHGTGIVIGETTVIGDNVKIYQGVTLGALNVRKEDAKKKRHPTIEDNVIVYSGTTILGGNTVIGHDSVVGGNVWLTKSIEPYSVVSNHSEIRVRNGKERFKTPINFVI
ncbi:MAG: serine acetyltransferase [Bacteroidales bacterium]|jgi:serine O-acetyltransferase|nr:serine acetyltransferase [Bacteroidales bacterium]